MLQQTKEKSKAYIVGLDASLTSFGVYCRPVNGDHDWYGFTISTDSKYGNDTSRVIDMATDIISSIDDLPHPPVMCVIEDYGPINRLSGKITQRAEMCGIIKAHVVNKYSIPLVTVPPNALKKFATGNGKASKDLIMKAAANKGYYPETNDEADAYFCALLGYNLYVGNKVCVSYATYIR